MVAAPSTTSTGPKYLDQLGKEADDSRTLVEVLCRRVVRPDFDSGRIPGRMSGVEELVGRYVPQTIVSAVMEEDREAIRKEILEGFAMRLVTEDEWDQVCQRIHAWQDELETNAGTYDRSPLSKILLKTPKFPTVERVRTLLGEEIAEEYKGSLEAMEADPDTFAEFPEERTSGGWNRHTAERAVSLVNDVIVPHAKNPDEMATAYGRYMEELRSQNREKKVTQNATKVARKAAARALGIWLPLQSDTGQWESDPRTCDRAPEFENLVMQVVEKMRILRSVLQYIPRRKFSNHTVQDMAANMERMRSYMKDADNKREREEKKKKKRKRSKPTAAAANAAAADPANATADVGDEGDEDSEDFKQQVGDEEEPLLDLAYIPSDFEADEPARKMPRRN